MKRKWGRVAYWFGIFLIFYAIYLGYYQSIINDRVIFEDDYCIKVNPLIIARKNAYIDSLKALRYGNINEYAKLSSDYLLITREYVETASEWNEKDEEYLNRRYFQLFVDKDTQEALQIQHDLYKFEIIGSILTNDVFEDIIENKGKNEEEITKKIIKNTDDTNFLSDKLTAKQTEIKKRAKTSIKSRLLRYPESNCPDENYLIPDVNMELQEIFKDSDSETYPGVIS